MEFVEAPAFTRHLSAYLSDDGYRKLQARLGANPGIGDLMPGAGGFRKMRWADPRRGKGTRGGLRIIYYHFPSEDQIWLVTIYDKDKAADLTPAEKKTLKTAIESELKTRAAGRASSEKRRRIH